MKHDFIQSYMHLYNSTKQQAEHIFISAIQCGDEDFIKEIIIEGRTNNETQTIKEEPI